MSIDFKTPITTYELVAIILSVLALIIPLIKFIYNKYVKKLKIDFLPSGPITLYFNKSGSYISIGGVYEAKNKSTTIKNISARVIRKSDNATLSLGWSTFSSPIFKSIAGKYENTFETAHPFKVERDSLYPVFVEFTNEKINTYEKINKIMSPLIDEENKILNVKDINILMADQESHKLDQFHEAELSINEYFFWKEDEYSLDITTEYDRTKFSKIYTFKLNKEDSQQLKNNINSMLVEPIANYYRAGLNFNTIRKTFY